MDLKFRRYHNEAQFCQDGAWHTNRVFPTKEEADNEVERLINRYERQLCKKLERVKPVNKAGRPKKVEGNEGEPV